MTMATETETETETDPRTEEEVVSSATAKLTGSVTIRPKSGWQKKDCILCTRVSRFEAVKGRAAVRFCSRPTHRAYAIDLVHTLGNESDSAILDASSLNWSYADHDKKG